MSAMPILNSQRKRECFSLDENVLKRMIAQSFVPTCSRHHCKSTSSISKFNEQKFSQDLHTSELCQIALQINSQVEDEFLSYKDRLNCSCAKKKYHSWPKHVSVGKHFKYHNYGLRDHGDEFLGTDITRNWDDSPQLSQRISKVSFNDYAVNVLDDLHPLPSRFHNYSCVLKERSLSLPCLLPTSRFQTSLKSLSSIDLQESNEINTGNLVKEQSDRYLLYQDTYLSKTKSKFDLRNITDEFNVFDEMCERVFPHNNILPNEKWNSEESFTSKIDQSETELCPTERNVKIDKSDLYLLNIEKEQCCNPGNSSGYDLNGSIVLSDSVDANSVSSFNDELTSADSGFSHFSDLSLLFNSVQSGIEAPLFKNRIDMMLNWFSDFSDEQRNIFIQRILGASNLPQMHMLSLKMENRLHEGCPTNCRDMLQWLPVNVAYQIMDYLDLISLSNASKVNRIWFNYAVHHHLWQKFCRSPDYKLSIVRHREQIMKYRNIDGIVQWRNVFIERYSLRKNWMSGKCRVKTFVGHTQGVSCVQFDNKRIVSGSSDKTIMVWDLTSSSNQPVLTLVGHSGTVRCLQLLGERLVSGSADTTIKVWDLCVGCDWKMAACRVTMIGHLDTVRCLQVDEEKVISGSYDKTIKVWELQTGRCKLTLRGHSGAVLCVQFDDQKIVSGSSDNTIKVWSLFTGLCLATFIGHHDAVTCLQFNNCHIISGSLDCTLKFWDLNSGQCVGTIDWIRSEGHTRVVRCLQADSWKIVSAGDDKTLKIWSLESGERFVTLQNHTDGVTCLRFDDFMIVSGSYDKTVKVWDFLPG